MNWLDIDDIIDALDEKYPNVDIMSLRFAELMRMIVSLDGFSAEESACNEKVLEAIQSAWLDLR